MSNAETLDARLLQAFPLPEVAEDSGKEDRGRLLVVAARRAYMCGATALFMAVSAMSIFAAFTLKRPMNPRAQVVVPDARVAGLTAGVRCRTAIAPVAQRLDPGP